MDRREELERKEDFRRCSRRARGPPASIAAPNINVCMMKACQVHEARALQGC